MKENVERLSREERESLFPEFRRDERAQPAPEAEAAVEPTAKPKSEPLVLSVMAKLADVLRRETEVIKAGDFEGFAELQREKSDLIRQAERLEYNRGAMRAVEDLDPGELQARIGGFNKTVEGNMRAIGAVKDAIGQVRSQAIRKLEDEKGDGVYSKDGAKKSLQHLSLNGTQVKL
ncbi:flagellar protein FlgN [Parvularcula maris]|uniref:Flagellar protein FlgN n=1 Tax=Parvularcula maris TaxID=2965077 RepID=A0A9X2RHZ9_9PROT|nr:flagellar protein FlgN [Parvularcula maris]MCQ8185505.1 flagellar protein FlgN [Parvularcula maris]